MGFGFSSAFARHCKAFVGLCGYAWTLWGFVGRVPLQGIFGLLQGFTQVSWSLYIEQVRAGAYRAFALASQAVVLWSSVGLRGSRSL